MNISKELLFSLLAIASSYHAMQGMEQSTSKLHIYAIPGQNGDGSETEYIENLLGDSAKLEITRVKTPGGSIYFSFADFGQEICLRRLRNSIDHNKKNSIIHATSQGTATTLNYIAETNNKNISCLILEATMASGNSTIQHTVAGSFSARKYLAKLPFAYYLLPYFAMIPYPFYFPSGRQPIKSVGQISCTLPIVIVHSKKDPAISYEEACALYYRLRSSGNKNVYFISKEYFEHTQILEKSDKPSLQAILQKHKVITSDDKNTIDLSAYQPDHRQYKHMYERLYKKEMKHEKIRSFVIFSAFLFSMFYLNQLIISMK